MQNDKSKITKRIICFGDSNTYGYDPRAFSEGRYPKEFRWPEIIQKETGWDVQNHGICGRTIPHQAGQISFALEQLAAWRQDVENFQLWVMLGTNDLLQDDTFTAVDTAKRMGHFLNELLTKSKTGNRNIRLISPVPMCPGAWTDDRICVESKKLEKEYQKLAETLGILFTETGSWGIPLAFDGVHFTEEGHRLFAEKMLLE